MNSRLEDLLRDSLADRAEDVRATPELWHRVEARTVARRRRTWVMAAAGTALAVVAGTVVVPDLLDRTPERPQILIDPSPSAPADEREPDALPTTGALADPTATHAVAVVDDMLHWYPLDEPGVRQLAVPTEASVQQLAVRPRVEGAPWHVAYVGIGTAGRTWDLRVVVLPGDALEAGVAAGAEELVLVTQPREVGDLAPGLAWSPDGDHLAWLRHDGGVTQVEAFDVTDDGGLPAIREVTFVGPNAGHVANTPSTARFTLAGWTWDAVHEDGVVGRLFLVGDGRAWAARLAHDPADVFVMDPVEGIGGHEDVSAAGPLTGPLGVELDVEDEPGASFRVSSLTSGEPILTWTNADRPVRPRSVDLAAAGDQLVVALDAAIVFHSPARQFVQSSEASVSAVDLARTPWTAPFVGDGTTWPLPDRGPANGQPGTAAGLPTFAVRAIDDRLEVIANVFGEGEPEVVRDLGPAPAFERPAPVHGVVVRPGSTLDDLEAVALVVNEGMYEFWWVRSTGDGSTSWDQFPGQHQPFAPVGDDLKPIPVFSYRYFDSTYRYLSWVDHGAGGEQTLRVIGWVDGGGPGTGDPASDNTGFAIDARGPVQLESWTWDGYETDEDHVPATLTFTATDEVGQSSSLIARVDRQPDGAIAMVDPCYCGEPGHGSHTHEQVFHQPSGWTWQLVSNAGGNQLYGWPQGGQVEDGPTLLPPTLRDHPGARSMELVPWGDAAVVVDPSREQVWILRNGSVDSFDGAAFDWVD